MEERYLEIKFYYWMLRLMKYFRYSATVIDVIEGYCNLGQIDSRIIKNLMRKIRDKDNTFRSYTEEIVYLGRKLNLSYRELQHDTGISLSQQLRVGKKVMQEEYLYQDISPKLTTLEYREVEKFMKIVSIIKEM